MRIPSVFVFFIVVVFFSNVTSAQEFWELLNFPDSVTVRCMDSNSEGHIFVGVGGDNEYGGIYRSDNNGTSWDLVYNNGFLGVSSLAINENDAIYAGVNGFDRFIVSNNEGIEWEVIELPDVSFGQIVKIECNGENEIYICPYGAMGAFIMFSFDSGMTWEISQITNKYNEYVSDLDISGTGDIYVSTMCYEFDQGGVYKSSDQGYSWDYVGLLNHQVLTLEINSQGDVFTGDWWVMNNDQPGIYALYNGSDEFELIRPGGSVSDIAITSDNHIYATTYSKVYYSFSNGDIFYPINDTLSDYMDNLYIDINDYLYAYNNYDLIKSINPIVTGESYYSVDNNHDFIIYPNPATHLIYLESKIRLEDKARIFLKIYSIFGRLVFEQEYQYAGGYIPINISSLQDGEYILKISSACSDYFNKFIKL